MLLMLPICAVVATSGCGASSYTPPSPEALISIENVGKWYQLYRSANRGKPPADEAEFLAFVNGTLADRGQELVSVDDLLKSPRDGEKYVVKYGDVTSRNQELNVVAYELTGENGTKLLVTELARSAEVDETELQEWLSGK